MKVVHRFEPLGLEIRCGFLAANASGAKHRDFLVLGWIEVFLNECREIPEAIRVGVNRARKGSDVNLIIVTSVHKHHVRV